jgi:Holliday junction resolvase
MKKRNSKFYFKNEKKVMTKLGFTPTKGSGSRWLEKEDGESEYFIAQLKTTERESITIKKDDLKQLIYHANVSHKIPVFVLEFLKEYQLLCVQVDDIDEFLEKMSKSEEEDI